MRRLWSIVAAVAVAGCGSVADKQKCAASTDCPVGQYCAHAGGESRCWADAVAPVVTSVTVTCAAPCVRDGVLHVDAVITDDQEVLDAAVTLDLAAALSVAMTPSGTSWVADVPLRSYPFGAFSRNVVATVTARDGARNASAAVAGSAMGVTRGRWNFDATVPMTSPAVMADGTAVVGLSRTSNQLLGIRPDGTQAWAVTVGTSGAFVTAAPAVGEKAVWVGSEDFSLYGVKLDGTGVLAGVGVNTGGAVRGAVAVLPGATKEWAFATSANGRVNGASDTKDQTGIQTADTFSAGPVVRQDGQVCTATSTASALASCYQFGGAFSSASWSVGVGTNVSAPIAIDASDAIWTISQDARLYRTTSTGTRTLIATLDGSGVDSPVILPDGDVVVGDQSGLLHRYSPTGTKRWSTEPNLGAAVLAPLVLTGGDATFLVATRAGTVHAVRSDGTVAWSTSLGSTELRAGNIHTQSGQSGQVVSTAYFSANNGKLYAVAVDGQLDGTAPWPKAFHDPRNTNRAGAQP